ncbi:MAG TPA: hypothetical protein VJJ46_08250 [Anaerolineales bacterium]|nr:hypothetical protein [Anaerolineales bacterium]
MNRRQVAALGLGLGLLATSGGAMAMAQATEDAPAGAVRAVDLVGAWVDAGAPETELFAYVGDDGGEYEATFSVDVLPLFTQANIWFTGAQACSTCHTSDLESSAHELDLSSYEGILAGADRLEAPPGEPIVIPGDWDGSSLRGRLRNNRMPTGVDPTVARNGPELTVNGGPVTVVDLIGAWVEAGAPEVEGFTFQGTDGSPYEASFSGDILPLFTQPDVFTPGSLACASCHTADLETSAHELDLTSYEGLLAGADRLEEPPGEPIIVLGDWEGSALRRRLRNNRMPSGIPATVDRDGPLVLHGEAVSVAEGEATLLVTGEGETHAVELIGAWASAGAPESDPFTFVGLDDQTYRATFETDVLPLFTTPNVWFAGAQACSLCHTADLESSAHELDLTSYEGILAGADRLEAPPGEPILIPGDWQASSLRSRLRNNRMPTGVTPNVPRNGPEITINGGTVLVVDLIGAWVDAGASEDQPFSFTGSDSASYEATSADILPLFTANDVFFEGGVACSACHTATLETSAHELDLTSYEGILAGADRLEDPPGEPILAPGDWDGSSLRGRLRNNRMPSGITSAIERDGPVVMAGTLVQAPGETEALPTDTASAPAATAEPEMGGGLSGGTIALIVIGVLVLGGGAYFLFARPKPQS